MKEKSHILPIFDHALFDRHFWILIFPIIYDKKMREKTHIFTLFSTTVTFWTSFHRNFYPPKNESKTHIFYSFLINTLSFYELFEPFSEKSYHDKMTKKNALFTHSWLCFDPFSPTFDNEIVRKNNEFLTLF